jgi:hypothetical protein
LIVDGRFAQAFYCAAEAVDAGFTIPQWNLDTALIGHNSFHAARIVANHRQAQSKRL